MNNERKALIVGVDYYPGLVERDRLRDSIEALFADKVQIALFYFAGHGYVDEGGGFLCSSEAGRGGVGIPLTDIMGFARESKASNKIIILDSCHGGIIGNKGAKSGVTEIDEGMTLFTASTASQYSFGGGNGAPGVFTNLMVDALEGAAANLVGDVTPAAFTSTSISHWDLGAASDRCSRRTSSRSYRFVAPTPPIALAELQQIATLFPTPNFRLKLDPSFEPERSREDAENANIPPPDHEKI
ncbi:caspase family protein [Rhizobium leguminosarum]|uniref:caspase family protein n=1 Tax=Rhizobium leguminosarum TaxID=384 RepID=UPI0021B0FA86|nr:caspase family protein [Rhizobium leguminosarum]